MERTVQRGDEWIKTERETDFDTGQSTTTRETSKGGSSTTVGQSAEGDLYAGHNGNVYKKTDDGWQSYDPDSGGWSDVQKPENPQGQGQAQAKAQTARESSAQVRQPAQTPAQTGQAPAATQQYSSASMYGPSEYSKKSSGASGYGSRDFSQLNRDAAARQGGTSSFQRNRSGGVSGGGGRTRRR